MHDTHRRIISTFNAMYNNKVYETLELFRTMLTTSDNGDMIYTIAWTEP